jgi:hypothetical protein
VPNRRFDLRVLDGPIPLDGLHSFEASNGGTRIDFVGEGRPGGVMRLAQPLLARVLERQFRGSFARLKAVMEAA